MPTVPKRANQKAQKAKKQKTAQAAATRAYKELPAAERGVIAIEALALSDAAETADEKSAAVQAYAERKELTVATVQRYIEAHLKNPVLMTTGRMRARGGGRKADLNGPAHKLRVYVGELLAPVMERKQQLHKGETVRKATVRAEELGYKKDPNRVARVAVNAYIKANPISTRRPTDCKEPPAGWEKATLRHLGAVRNYAKKHKLEVWNLDETALCPFECDNTMIAPTGARWSRDRRRTTTTRALPSPLRFRPTAGSHRSSRSKASRLSARSTPWSARSPGTLSQR